MPTLLPREGLMHLVFNTKNGW